MSLNDWIKIFDDLSDAIQSYVNKPNKKPASVVRRIDDTNFELNVSWIDMDAQFYSKLLTSIDFDYVFPFVIKLKVLLRSNIDKYVAPETTASPVRKKILKKKSADKSLEIIKISVTNGVNRTPIEIKECCVRLPLLQFDENGQVIQHEVTRKNKRKRSTIEYDVARTVKTTPNRDASIFMCTSSTPFIRGLDVADVSDSIGMASHKVGKSLTNRLTTTPRSTKSGSHFNPRIRLLKLPANVSQLESAKKKKKKKTIDTKNQKKSKAKTTQKRPKTKVQSIANESDLFEIPEIQPVKKVIENTEKKKLTPKPFDIVKIEDG